MQPEAGFLRVYGGGRPLDATSIHPESYDIASGVLKRANTTLKELFVEPPVSPSNRREIGNLVEALEIT